MELSLTPNILFFLLVCCFKIKNGLSQSSAISDIVDNVRNYQHSLAQDQILELNDKSKIPQIIHELYQNKEDSFEEIFNFEKELTRVDLSFHILRALRNEMVANKHDNPRHLITLAKAFDADVVHQENNDKFIAAESKKIISEIKIDVKKSATDLLTAAILSNNFVGNETMRKLAEDIFNFYYDLNHEVMTEVVNRIYPHIPAMEIISLIMNSSKYIPQKVSVILKVFEKLENDNDLNNEGVLSIAKVIKALREEDNYFYLFPHQKYEVNLLIDKLPQCARSLYLAEEVCLWNRGREEYLYRDGSQRTSSKRIAFTNVPTALKVGEAAWFVEHLLFGQVRFKSQLLKKEYLTTSNDVSGNFVETKEKEEPGFDENVWNIELDGDYCLIRNQNVGEYLVASDIVRGRGRRVVMSASATALEYFNRSDFLWQIRDCF